MVNTELPFERVVKKSLVVISAGIPITITFNDKLMNDETVIPLLMILS